jgi:hypothetical protein
VIGRSQVTGKTFIVDPRRANVMMLSTTPMSPDASTRRSSHPQVYDYMAVPSGSIIKILP